MMENGEALMAVDDAMEWFLISNPFVVVFHKSYLWLVGGFSVGKTRPRLTGPESRQKKK